MLVLLALLPIFAILLILISLRSRSVRFAPPYPSTNEPDVFASPEADLDPESDTGEPKGQN